MSTQKGIGSFLDTADLLHLSRVMMSKLLLQKSSFPRRSTQQSHVVRYLHMPYMIDGHNLIACLPGINLHDPDDEARLIELLVVFCSKASKRATVYFDRGAWGNQDPVLVGSVTARFVKAPHTADQAIASHLGHLGGEAKNWTVVSSDRDIQRAARSHGSRILDCHEFVQLLYPESPHVEIPEKPSEPSSQEEIAFWEKLFQRKRQS
jgi:predicted RNA-binding protein with PIN domain